MKINWGTSILIAFALFITFILYFVIKVQSDSKYDNELVVEDYYKHDSNFEKEMNRIQNSENLEQKPTFFQEKDSVFILFPNNMDGKLIQGKVIFYRASNKKFDFEIPIQLKKMTVAIPKTKFIKGNWNINLEWNYNGTFYLTKNTIYIQ